jgi:hypothetical protein
VRTILACGSRNYTNYEEIRLVLRGRQFEFPEPLRLIHGAARGADTLAARAAVDLGYEQVEAFPADWEHEGKRAGILRNLQMLDENPDLVIAFGEGRGTSHTVGEALRRGIPVRRF